MLMLSVFAWATLAVTATRAKSNIAYAYFVECFIALLVLVRVDIFFVGTVEHIFRSFLLDCVRRVNAVTQRVSDGLSFSGMMRLCCLAQSLKWEHICYQVGERL